MSASISAQTAKAIRKELKCLFPDTSFSVTSKGYAGGSHVMVSWANGPTQKEVISITDKYRYGHFNPMEDTYEIREVHSDLPQVKYVLTHRDEEG